MTRLAFPLLWALLLAAPADADDNDPPPFPEFTFKRVGVPTAGAAQRITVQVDPEAEPWDRVAQDPEPDADVLPDPAGMAPYGWYWALVSPQLSEAGSGRLALAVAALGQGVVPAPGLQDLSGLALSHGTDILRATVGTRVSPALVLAVMAVESSGRAAAVSPKGAVGLMQLMPDTADRFGVEDRTDAAESIRGGVAYLDWLMKTFGGDPVIVLAGYNAGEGAVRAHAGVPPYAETRAYVPKVLAAWEIARRLCKTPPELISDGCVFSVAGGQG